jgi:hypothetical protein
MKRNHGNRLEFKPLHVTFVEVTEATANVVYLSHVVKERWGPHFRLVTSDGMVLEDSSGTQGLKFWKVGSRKLYAVSEKFLKVSKGKGKYAADTTSSSDSDDVPKPKHFKYDSIGKDLKDIKGKLCSLVNIQKNMKVPLSLQLLLTESFKCCICQELMHPPVIFSRCCKCLIGCENCVDKWYGTDGRNKSCPKCLAERSYSETTRLYGIDDFLCGVKKLSDSD